MTDNLTIKNSKIAGRDVFAVKNIKKGELIYMLAGERINLEELIKRANEETEQPSDPLQIGDEEYLDLDEFSRTFNHSCEPNAYVRNESELVALRDINEGEEITFDYSTTMADNTGKITAAGRKIWTTKCNCGSKNCRGVIDQFITLTKEIQGSYINNKLMPNFMLKKFAPQMTKKFLCGGEKIKYGKLRK